MILLIDNYDSFVFNLDRYLRELGCETRTVRNDAISISEVERLQPQAIVISPGPCTPNESGESVAIIREFGATVPLLGVCLGHQAIAVAYGGQIVRAPEPIHGRASEIRHDGTRLFEGLPNPLTVGRYHSLVAEPESLPGELRVTASMSDGVIMALEHRQLPVFGVQFHPESVLTVGGHMLLKNFLSLAGIDSQTPPLPEYAPPVEEADFYRQPIGPGAGRLLR
ncbi:MAG: aminodeoxychorismate/anthranilate synthase component II [Planctomycetaceae bacterium]|nr:aminodeoxychorismate/anthranilate synthase component II [Planctomycetaceae bacterium]